MKLLRRAVKRGRVEIIPMIDTILILLIFYMTFSTFRANEKVLGARLPHGPPETISRPKGLPPPPVIVLHVVDRDRIVLNGHSTMDVDTLAMLLIQAGGDPETRVVIEAEPTTRYEHVVNALDACAMARLSQVAFRPILE